MSDDTPDPRVVDFADWKIRKADKRYFPEPGICSHRHLTMDRDGHVVVCDDCKLQLSAYSVLERMLDDFRKARDGLAAERRLHQARVAGDLRLTAAKNVERAWRSRSTVPACPHCSRGIFAADGFGQSSISAEIELARRNRDGVKPYTGVRPAANIVVAEAAMMEDL